MLIGWIRIKSLKLLICELKNKSRWNFLGVKEV